ncbi:MAG TPA: transglycosylase domain-containing protein [Acidocella sp.]|nr:transglycosylase domain-containing protein [Acidocella sp.]
MLKWLTLAALLVLLGWALSVEARTSYLQARFFTWFDSGLHYWPAPGASPSIRFPHSGPRDIRLGYAALPVIIPSLQARQFEIARQALWSPRLDWFVAHGGYAPYVQKLQAGLRLYDRNGVPLFAAAYPNHVYADFNDVPPLVASTLSSIEDRDLLDLQNPFHNPAVAWERFILAAGGRIASVVNPHWQQGGASTLATQIVKFSDSPGGRTSGMLEKLRQMLTAAPLAYMNGPDTLSARHAIVVTYLNSTPLASRPGYGEVIGVPEALSVWYGTDPAEANAVLTQPQVSPRQGVVYREVLSLILAGQRPAYYLVQNRPALEFLTDAYLLELARVGIISPGLRDAALAARLPFINAVPPPPEISYTSHKATTWLKTDLLSMLHVPNMWSLDRYDLSAYSTIDEAAQERVTGVLTQLGDPAYAQALGLYGHLMLASGDNPALLKWSFVLYERGAGANFVRIHADNLNQPFDINSGVKLQLGSTAKLRTLVTYLDIMVALHDRLAALPAPELAQIAATMRDPLTVWAASYLATAPDRSLQPMLDAAMQRKYPAWPMTYFTGGGNNSFGNFEPWENTLTPTVEYAFENSINCAFVRLMHDIRDYYTAQSGIDQAKLLSDPHDPARLAYLRRFAAQEGSRYLHGFYTGYRGLSAQQALERLAGHTTPQASHLADLFLAIHPDATQAEMTAFLQAHMPKYSFAQVTGQRLAQLYGQFANRKLSLNDEAYVANVHPLEIWLVQYLTTHPQANWKEVSAAGQAEIQDSYAWLIKRRKTFQQNVRIRTLMEQDAFKRIWEDWRRQGYPFDHLVPSLGTAIGASGDKPDALAKLVGIILNNGVRQTSVNLDRLDFATGTPFETGFISQPVPQPVLNPAVVQTLRRALLGVVQNGTGGAVAGAYKAPDGSVMAVGGKTGSGDNRYHIYGPGGVLRGERVVDRTATFVFFLGDHFFGTVTAYVPGPQAAHFNFTSAIAVQLLKDLKPQLAPLLWPAHAESPPKGAT